MGFAHAHTKNAKTRNKSVQMSGPYGQECQLCWAYDAGTSTCRRDNPDSDHPWPSVSPTEWCVEFSANDPGIYTSFGSRLVTSYSLQVPVTGFSITMPDATQLLLLKPAGSLATGTVVTPPNPIDGQIMQIRTSKTISSLTLSPNAGQAISADLITALSGLSPALTFAMMYHLSDTTWY
jgi:hypothetical protein